MIRLYIIVIIFNIFFITACNKGSIGSTDIDYLIFGHFYGECSGETCVKIFKLEANRLLEDTKKQYPNNRDFYFGRYVKLSNEKFLETKDLLDYFPADLLTEPNNVIGQPDAGDWGGLYVEYNFDGVRKFWLLDQMEMNVPPKYHLFIDKINEKIDNLR